MANIEAVKATMDHVEELAVTMREEDVAEIWASGHLTPIESLTKSLEMSTLAKAIVADGKVLAVFGVVPMGIMTGVCVVWFLSSKHVNSYKKSFIKFCKDNRKNLCGVKAYHDILFNYVDARYKASVKWLGWLGFSVSEPEPFGVEGLPFHKIVMEVN